MSSPSNDVAGASPERKKPAEEASEDTINVVKTLQFVLTSVNICEQLEEQFAKSKIDHEEALEKQASYKEKINQLQAQLAAQEIKYKNEITANLDLEEIRKQNDSETVRLGAMFRRAELKSNSLAELVEQKTKENKELAQITDELIARVGVDKSE